MPMAILRPITERMVNMSNTFSAVAQQIKIFKEMQETIAKDTSILSEEERQELEGYVDNQRRQCELYLKLKPKQEEKAAEPKPAAAKLPKKAAKSKKAEAAPVDEKSAEELLGQDLFTEPAKNEADDIDIDDLLG